MASIRHEIVIGTSPELIWDVLRDSTMMPGAWPIP
jgi:hypothetical protein